jgi:hypothetical protein
MAHDHRVPTSWPHRSLETEILQLRRQPFRGPPAIIGIGWVGRNAGDTDEIEKPPQAGVDLGIHVRQHAIEACRRVAFGHVQFLQLFSWSATSIDRRHFRLEL